MCGGPLVELVGPRIFLSVLFAKGRLGYKQSTSFPLFCVLFFLFPMLDPAWMKSLPFFLIKSIFSKMKISKNDSNTLSFKKSGLEFH